MLSNRFIERSVQLQAVDDLLWLYADQAVEMSEGAFPLETGAALEAAVDDLC